MTRRTIHSYTPISDAEYERLTKRTQLTEWVLEPMDEHGDIIDPWYYDSEKQALADVGAVFRSFPEAVTMAMARVVRKGSEAEGELTRDYEYRAEWKRDGDGFTAIPLTLESR